MRIVDLLNAIITLLPINQAEDSDFRENVKKKQKLFLNLFRKINKDDLMLFLPAEYKYLTRRMLLYRFERITRKINTIIDCYYDGYPDDAYKNLHQLLNHVSFITNLKDGYGNFLIIKDPRKLEKVSYFRIRSISKDEIEPPTEKEMFHVSFEKRGLVSTNRFSISGFPCLYLGRSLQVCYEELNSPIERVYANRLEMNPNKIYPLNLTIPEPFTENIYDDNDVLNYDAFCFLLTFPLIHASLFKVKAVCKNDNFKPEYIIPQLLLQYVKKEAPSSSILYTSTKVTENNSNELYHNIVIPVIKIATKGYCPELSAKIKVSKPIQIKHFSNKDLLKAEKILLSYTTQSI